MSTAPRLLYYAIGGGLGHLVRAGRFLCARELAESAVILSASEHAADARLSSGVPVRRVPSELQHDIPALREWLTQAIEDLAPDIVCVDCFPAGVLGELADLPALRGIELWYVARLMRWKEYAPLARAAPHYAMAWRLEPLQPEHERWLSGRCAEVSDFQIPTPSMPPQTLPDGRAFWLVAHSGPRQEVSELIDYAMEQRRIEAADVAIAVASFDPPSPLPEGCIPIAAAPLAGWYVPAQRIFGAAGFNFVNETERFRSKRVLLPFPRRYDDQFERARRNRSG